MGNLKQVVPKAEILIPRREFRLGEVWAWLALPERRSSSLRVLIIVIVRGNGSRAGHSESCSVLMAGDTQVGS
jgi:hypothetical protein